jgi:hypothetical protein
MGEILVKFAVDERGIPGENKERHDGPGLKLNQEGFA